MMSHKPTLTFRGIHLLGSLVALSAIEQGFPVTFFIPENTLTTSQLELTSLFRWKIIELRSSMKELNYLNTIAAQAPYLFYPQRVADLSSHLEVGSKMLLLMDKAHGKDRENSSLPIHIDSQTGFESVNPSVFSKGILNREFLIDQNRLTALFVSKCIQLGVQVIDEEPNKNDSIIECSNQSNQLVQCLFKNCSTSFKNTLRVQLSWGTLSLISRDNNLLMIINLIQNKNTPKIEEILQLMAQLGLTLSEEHQIQLKSALNSHQTCQAQHALVLPKLSIADSMNQWSKYLKQISKETGIKFKKSTTLNSPNNIKITHYEFIKTKIDECDRLFDLAKQTGIPYIQFQQLFYRYGTDPIDWMIETAYEMMNETRMVDVIWNRAERLYLNQFEPWHKNINF